MNIIKSNRIEITQKRWDEALKDFSFYDCTIINNQFGFVLNGLSRRHNDYQPDKRLLGIDLYDGKYMLSYPTSNAMGITNVSAISKGNALFFAAIDTYGNILHFDTKGNGNAGGDEKVNANLPTIGRNPSVLNVFRVGNSLFAVGGFLGIYRRMAKNKWKRENLPIIDNPDNVLHGLAGFSENDMYAVGEKGNIWHFDGENWTQIPMNRKANILQVCCTENGEVYIAFDDGELFKKENDNWIKIGKTQGSYSDMVWFDGQLWLAKENFDELYFLNSQKQLELHPLSKTGFAERLDVSPDGKQMISCGYNGTLLFSDQANAEVLIDMIELKKQFNYVEEVDDNI